MGTPNTSLTPVARLTASATRPVDAEGFLWWVNDRRQNVYVSSPLHQQLPVNMTIANQWVQRSEACFAEAGAAYQADESVQTPSGMVGVRVLTGACAEFSGWVMQEALHADPP
jgi:hypothetical protein